MVVLRATNTKLSWHSGLIIMKEKKHTYYTPAQSDWNMCQYRKIFLMSSFNVWISFVMQAEINSIFQCKQRIYIWHTIHRITFDALFAVPSKSWNYSASHLSTHCWVYVNRFDIFSSRSDIICHKFLKSHYSTFTHTYLARFQRHKILIYVIFTMACMVLPVSLCDSANIFA